MKTFVLAIISFTLISCSSTNTQSEAVALQQAKSNLSVGLTTGRSPIGTGYEVSGHASTNVFGIRPYGSFIFGVSYVSKNAVVLPAATGPAPAAAVAPAN